MAGSGLGLNWWGPAQRAIKSQYLYISLSPFPAPRRHDVLLEPRSETDFRFQMKWRPFIFARVMRPAAGGGRERAAMGPTAPLLWEQRPARGPVRPYRGPRCSECRESHHAEVPGRWERRLFQATPGPYRSRESVRQHGAQSKPSPGYRVARGYGGFQLVILALFET